MELGNKVFGAMAWSGIQRILLQAIQFGLGIVLARILTPKEYGTMAILLIFIVLSQVFIDSGFTKALIQKVDRTEDDKSTVFLFNVAIAALCYLVLWAISPILADFYEIDELTILFRVIGITLLLNALYSVPNTLITINLDYKLIAKISLLSVIISGIIAIILAIKGYGVWSLVYQSLIRSFLSCFLYWGWVRWIPNLKFSKKSFKALFSYGSKLLVSSLLAKFFGKLNALLIGKYYSAMDLGFYTRGTQFSDIVYNIFSPAINEVLLPGLAPLQNQKKVLVGYARTIAKTTTLLTLPIFLMLAILAEPLVLTLLTEKWAPAIPIMQIFCFARLVTVVGGININLLYIIGRTDLVLKQQYFCIAIRVVLVLSALPFGVLYIALAELLSSIIHFFINAYFPGKLLGYGGVTQLKDNLRIIFAGLIMLIPLYFSFYIFENRILLICLSPIIALLVYLMSVYFFKVKELTFVIEKAKQFIK